MNTVGDLIKRLTTTAHDKILAEEVVSGRGSVRLIAFMSLDPVHITYLVARDVTKFVYEGTNLYDACSAYVDAKSDLKKSD